jgi:ACS family hexuronate transporter-like MFS transporter
MTQASSNPVATGSSGQQSPGNPAGGNVRWVICALLFFSVAVNYIDRLTISILKGPLSVKLHWSETDYGYIAAMFNFAYAFGYLIGGRLIDRLGVKRGLSLFVLFWSSAAMAHGLCGFFGVTEEFRLRYPWFSWGEKSFVWMTLVMPMTAAGFMFARVVLGLSEGGNFPGAIKTVAEWFPIKERALATGLFNAGTNVGAIICPLVVKWMFEHWGWQATFYATGATGFAWLIAWWLLYESPEKHPHLSPAELAYIRQGQPAVQPQLQKVPWLSLLGYRAVWAYIIAGILASPAWTFYQFFLPDFLDKAFKLDLDHRAWWTSAFYVIAAVGGVAGGWLAGALLGRGWTLNAARKVSFLICAILVVPVFLAPFAGHVWLAVLIIGIAGSAHQGWSANLFSFVSDTMPREAISSVVGLGGFVTYLTGGFISALTGQIVQKTNSYVPIFIYFSGMYVISVIAIHLLVPRIGAPTQRS